MDNNLNYSSEIKKGIISLLMFQLYSDERTIYREYVQNALDSINMAVAEHLLDQPKDGMVNINIDRKNILVLRNAFEKTRKQMKANALSINALSDNLNFPMFAELTLKKT